MAFCRTLPCAFLALGFCKDASICPYEHVEKPAPILPPKPHITTELHNIKGTIVKLGPGAEVLGLKLSTDFSAVRIGNLAPGTTPEGVQARVNRVGALVSLEDIRIKVGKDSSATTVADIEVEDPAFAKSFLQLVKNASSRAPSIQMDVSIVPHSELVPAHPKGPEVDLDFSPGVLKERRHALIRDADPADLAECPICTCEVTAPFPLPCGHFYCTECLRAQCAAATEFPLRCCGDSDACATTIPLEDLRAVLPKPAYIKTIETALATAIAKTGIRHCPTPDCAELYRPARASRTFSCPQCRNTICASCNVITANANDAQDAKDANNSHGDILACFEFQQQQLARDETTQLEQWKRENGCKECPRCAAPIQKLEGTCNNVRCRACGGYFCWFCLEECASSAEVYGHMTTVHGDWGLGVAIED